MLYQLTADVARPGARIEPGAVRHEYRGTPVFGERCDTPSQPLELSVLAERRIGQQEGRPTRRWRGRHSQFGTRAGRRQPYAGQPQFGWVGMLDAHSHCGEVCGLSDELSRQLAEASERVVHANVALCGVVGQQCGHGAGDAGRRADHVAVYADFPHEGVTKPPEVTGKEARGKLHDFAHRLECARPQPGRRGVRAPSRSG